MWNHPVLVAVLSLLAGLLSASAHAQAVRTWVSGVGDDVNPCSRTAPCKTFAGAISKTAAGGEINVLDPGGFGAVTITKPITIDGGEAFASILASGTNGIIVNISEASFPNAVVIIRNLSINGASQVGTPGVDGIRWVGGGAALHVEDCLIFGFGGQGIEFIPTSDVDLFVRDTQISDAAGGGILVKPGTGANARASVNGVQMDRNQAYGLRAEDRSRVSVVGSVAGRGSAGIVSVTSAAGQQTLVEVVDSVIENNSGNGLSATGTGAALAMASTLIRGNGTGISGNVRSWGNNYNIHNANAGTPASAVTPQ